MPYFSEYIYPVLEILGVFSFGVSGAMCAIKRKLDLFGVIFLGVTMALGGGVVRDLMLGIVPPSMFQSYTFLITSAAASLAVFAAAVFFHPFYERNSEKIERINNVFDAIGLGIFAVIGTRTAMVNGYADNAFFCMFLGMTTGCVGGILCDIMTGEIPAVLRKRIYAVAALFGALLYYLLVRFGADETCGLIFAALCIFTIRMLATKFKWNFPHAP